MKPVLPPRISTESGGFCTVFRTGSDFARPGAQKHRTNSPKSQNPSEALAKNPMLGHPKNSLLMHRSENASKKAQKTCHWENVESGKSGNPEKPYNPGTKTRKKKKTLETRTDPKTRTIRKPANAEKPGNPGNPRNPQNPESPKVFLQVFFTFFAHLPYVYISLHIHIHIYTHVYTRYMYIYPCGKSVRVLFGAWAFRIFFYAP